MWITSQTFLTSKEFLFCFFQIRLDTGILHFYYISFAATVHQNPLYMHVTAAEGWGRKGR